MKTKTKGITAIELLLWTAVFIILVPMIVTLFDLILKLTSKSYALENSMIVEFTGEGQVLKDFRSGSRAELGNLLLNGGFELKESDTQPKHWHAAATGNGSYDYVQSSDPQLTKNGFYSLSLVSNDGTQITYRSSDTFTMTPNAAYMLSGSIHETESTTHGTIELVKQSDGTILASGTSGGANWSDVSVRYPSAGLLATPTVAYIRLSWDAGGVATQNVYFDDVSIAPIHAVLLSQTDPVNVTNTVSDVTDPADSAGYRMYRWENNVLTLYRYRVEMEKGLNVAVREYYDYGAGRWKLGSNGKSIQGLQKFIITYDENSNLPPNGKDTPVKLYFEYIDPSSDTGVGEKHYTVKPLAP